MALGIVIAVLAASEVSVAVRPGVECVEQHRLVTRLESAGLRVVPGPSQRLAVTIEQTRQDVTVRAVRQGAPFERKVPGGPEACPATERVLAALITAWSQQLPSVEPRELKRPLAPPVRPEVVVPPAPPLEPEVLEVAKAEEPELPLTPEPSTPKQLEPVVQASPKPSPAQRSEWPLTVEIAALGGGGLGPTPDLAGQGQVNVGASLGRLGLLLEGGLESVRSGALSSGARVETSMQWLSLSGRVRFQPLDRLRLDLAVGFRLWRIAAQSFDQINPQQLDLLGLGGVLSGGASLRVLGPLSLHLRAFGSLRSRSDLFLIEGLGPVLELNAWEAGALLGVEVRVFGGS